MVDLALYIEEQPQELAPEIVATQAQEEIVRLKLRIEELEARRDEAAEKAFKAGVHIFAGYRISEKKPAGTISEKKLAEQYPEIMDGFSKWYLDTAEIKLTKKGLQSYLKETENQNPDKVLADITTPGKGGPTYTLTKMKEAAE